MTLDAPRMTTTPPMPPSQSAGLSRHWKWLLPTAALVVVAFFAAGVLLMYSFASEVMRNSDPYAHAMARVHTSAAVADALGMPIVEGWIIHGRVRLGPESGDADLEIPISGPKGSAKVKVVAERRQGVWYYRILSVEIAATQQRIPLESRRTNSPPH